MRNLVRSMMAGAAALLMLGSAQAADGVDAIKQRGTLIVGVKADYKPFGFRDPAGNVVGLEPDLAADIAKRLGVKLELVPVAASNRIEFLQQGKIDLLIATMSDKPERRRVVQAIEPLYYSDYVNILLNKKAGIKDWADLKGKPVCATSGAWYNKDIAKSYGPEIVAFDGSEKPLFAMKQGNCIGYRLRSDLPAGQAARRRVEGRLRPAPEGCPAAPWMMAVALENTSLQTLLEDTTKDWMKTGFIVDAEKKWGIAPTEYSVSMHEQYKDK